jgi:hypothetical protein
VCSAGPTYRNRPWLGASGEVREQFGCVRLANHPIEAMDEKVVSHRFDPCRSGAASGTDNPVPQESRRTPSPHTSSAGLTWCSLHRDRRTRGPPAVSLEWVTTTMQICYYVLRTTNEPRPATVPAKRGSSLCWVPVAAEVEVRTCSTDRTLLTLTIQGIAGGVRGARWSGWRRAGGYR